LIQATEAIKLILGRGKPLIGRLFVYDALDPEYNIFTLNRREECPLCGKNPVIKDLDKQNYESTQTRTL